MSAIGVEPVKHGFGQKLERRRHHMQTSASMSSLGGFSSIPGDEAGSTIKRPKPIVLPTPGLAPADEQVELATAEVIMSGAVSPESRGRSRPQTASDRPLSPNLAGLEGLLIPRYTNRSPSPTKSGRARLQSRSWPVARLPWHRLLPTSWVEAHARVRPSLAIVHPLVRRRRRRRRFTAGAIGGLDLRFRRRLSLLAAHSGGHDAPRLERVDRTEPIGVWPPRKVEDGPRRQQALGVDGDRRHE